MDDLAGPVVVVALLLAVETLELAYVDVDAFPVPLAVPTFELAANDACEMLEVAGIVEL